jgi:chromosome segregation ATPase
MRWSICVLSAAICVVICSGCSSPETETLKAEVQQLQDRLEQLEARLAEVAAENDQLQSDLDSARQELADVEQIKHGYEAARAKVKENMSQLGALLGNTESPLPAFEDLKNSDWASNLMPGGGQLPADLKSLENKLKGLLGGQGNGAGLTEPPMDANER